METLFGQRARLQAFNNREWELMVGSLLGDATLLHTTAGYCFRVHHSPAQHALVDWKYAELIRYVRTAPKISGTGYYFRTITHPRLTDLRNSFYNGAKKIIPFPLLQQSLTAFGLAVWIMDDGAADGKQLRINTQSFTFTENVALAKLIKEKFGIAMTLNSDKGKPRLRCGASSIERLVSLVRAHTLPAMLYKLSAAPETQEPVISNGLL